MYADVFTRCKTTHVAGQMFDPQHFDITLTMIYVYIKMLRVKYLTRNIVAGQIFDP